MWHIRLCSTRIYCANPYVRTPQTPSLAAARTPLNHRHLRYSRVLLIVAYPLGLLLLRLSKHKSAHVLVNSYTHRYFVYSFVRVTRYSTQLRSLCVVHSYAYLPMLPVFHASNTYNLHHSLGTCRMPRLHPRPPSWCRSETTLRLQTQRRPVF